jgi:hypothetical protein
MAKVKANGLMEATLKEAFLISDQLMMGVITPKLSGFSKSLFDSVSVVPDTNNFELTLKAVDEDVCENLKSLLGALSMVQNITDDCLKVTFNKNLTAKKTTQSGGTGGESGGDSGNGNSGGNSGGEGTTEPVDPCADVDCGDNGTCEDGACVCDGGYYLDGTECTMCAAGTYAAAGANVCTPCPDGMTSDAGATSANDCENEPECCMADLVCTETNPGYCALKDSECTKNYPCPATASLCKSAGLQCFGSGSPLSFISYDNYLYNGCVCYYVCFTADTPIMLADGTCKRADEITYDDELLVWDFDNGCFAKSKPLWLKQAQIAQEYNYLRFSDGSVLKTISQHRIFNREAGKFTYPMTDETPIGTHTLNAKGEWVTLVEKRVVQEEVVYYNIITDYHMNCFAGNVLTSCRFNNLYPIQDLKFVKDDRELVPYLEYAELPRKWYDGLRLAEQPREVNRGNDDCHANSIVEHVQNVYIKLAQ